MTLRIRPLVSGAFLTLATAACTGHTPNNAVPQPVAAAESRPYGVDSVVSASAGAENAAVAPAARGDSVSAFELIKQAVRVFGDSVVQQGTPEGEVAFKEEDFEPESSSDLKVAPYLSQARVEHYVSRFTGPSREYIETRLERGSRYEPMIRRMMREGGLPEDMYYLALVESGYDPHAYSRAAAVGMWQFMTSTARGMGLRVDWWVDERRDPVKSTRAAVRFIRGMRDQFGSLYLAAAAYNGGPGRIARGLSRYADELDGIEGDDAFFALAEKDYLKNETKEYVPQLIAAALIARDPQRYGLTIRSLPAFEYDSARVPAETPLAAVAKAADTTVAAIRELNPQLLRGMTPPKGTTMVRLPLGSGLAFDSALAALPKSERTALRRVTTRKDDTWERVAAREKISVSAGALARFNPKAERTKKGRLLAWQRLIVPSPAVASAALSVPDPSIERYGSSRRRGRSVMHVVKSGENLGSIAARYRTSTKTLMRLNRLKKPVIFPGQSLVVSGAAGSAKASSSSKGAGTTNRAGAKKKSAKG